MKNARSEDGNETRRGLHVGARSLADGSLTYPAPCVPRYKLTIAYDGTDFCGWQKQEPPAPTDGSAHPHAEPGLEAPEGRTALRTVQAVVERAIREIVREPIILVGSSRTDAGVHAKGQVGAFTCGDGPETPAELGCAPEGPQQPASPSGRHGGWPLSRGVDRLLRAVNSRLPDDVLITSIEPAAPTFDPIQDTVAKAYSYTIHTGQDRPLWDRRYVFNLHMPLDATAMHEAARVFVGEHDFNAFAAAGHGRLTTVRTVLSCGVTTPGVDRVRIDISGTGFLYNMVRIIAGTLVEVGKKKMSAGDVSAALASLDRRRAGPTLPPDGLCLEWVKYA